MMMIESKNLNQAAAYIALGGKLLYIKDTYPQWEFVIEAKPWQIWYEKHIGIIPYRRFCNKRTWLKEQHYRHEGKEPYFRGRNQGFVFNDVVRVVRWDKKKL